ncbi:unnamed protein product [Parnassius mnemosyne]|uniref:UDP-glucuronosyltransferase n=1 Tax=Parnassius mnemosyne TaxID=213953 RepID=A0AAV1LEX5_9NEOP
MVSPLRICLVVLSIATAFTEAYNILVVSSFPSKSHAILGDAYVNLLLDAGHEVTYINANPSNNSNPLLHEIDVSEIKKYLKSDLMNLERILNKEFDAKDQNEFVEALLSISKATLENVDVAKIISNTNLKFDLIIAEWMFTEVYAGFSAIFDCPFIWFTTMEPFWTTFYLIDEASNPTYTTFPMSNNIAPFTFKERVQELILQVAFYFTKEWNMYFVDKELYTKTFAPAMAQRGKALPPYDEIRFNASMILGNSHVSLGDANRLPQNYKPIAGYHINQNVKPLTKELKNIMDNSKNGVIYFSLGSNVRSKDLPDIIKRKLINIFSQLEQTVLWKFEEDFPDLPKNIHVLKWAPQQSILAHPNCIMFITHGGLLSITEAVHFGVPIIGIPVFADQHINVQKAVKKGFAKQVDLSFSIVEDIEDAIQEMLHNSSYRNKAKEFSFIYHHRPISPGAEFVHWVEHVVRTKGAAHLRSPAFTVTWYQKLYLDLIAVIAITIVLTFVCMKLIVRICSRNNESHMKKMN